MRITHLTCIIHCSRFHTSEISLWALKQSSISPQLDPTLISQLLRKRREVRQITPSVFSQEFIYRGCAHALVFHSVWINTKKTVPTLTNKCVFSDPKKNPLSIDPSLGKYLRALIPVAKDDQCAKIKLRLIRWRRTLRSLLYIQRSELDRSQMQ